MLACNSIDVQRNTRYVSILSEVDCCVACSPGQEISLKAGDVVTLIEPDTDGWCFVSCRGKEGWVAADCLKQG
eukprot:m.941607 g.941607  ORF g.941607 m.941607 type:complete len:73 (-) comp23834_c2_seq11:577-795(-)